MRLGAVIIAAAPLLAAPAFAASAGFEELTISNGAEAPLTVGIWYPANAPATADSAGHGLKLVVMSHGGGGSYDGHYDTARALASAGFVVAAVSHAGDTSDDQSKVLQLWRRPAQLHRLVDYMLAEWSRHGSLDAARVGAFGFSNGGFTVLVAAGGALTFRGPVRIARSTRIMTCAGP